MKRSYSFTFVVGLLVCVGCAKSSCPKNTVTMNGVCISANGALRGGDAGETANGGGGGDAAVRPVTHKDAGTVGGASSGGSHTKPHGNDGSVDDEDAGTDAGSDAGPTDPCAVASCAAIANCTVKAKKAVCTCPQGYIGDGLTCTRDVCQPLNLSDPPACSPNMVCSNGTTGPQPTCTCAAHFIDCDKAPANGCEVDTSSDKNNCGACGVTCAGNCVAGACEQKAKRLVLGGEDSCAFTATTSGSNLACWGLNNYASFSWDLRLLGNPTVSSTYVLKPVAATSLVASDVSLGGFHTCAIPTSGDQVICWGNNDAYQLGTTSTVAAGARFAMSLPGVTDVAAGNQFTCAVQGGNVWCWGRNDRYQLGNSRTTVTSIETPVQVDNIPAGTASAVETGGHEACALTKNGQVYCWGNLSSTPTRIVHLSDGSVLSDIVQVVVGAAPTAPTGSANDNLICALDKFGHVYCWGPRSYVSLAGIIDMTDASTMGKANSFGLYGATQIAAGVSHVCAILTTGEVMCAGLDQYGVLGSPSPNTAVIVTTPKSMPGLTDAIDIAASAYHTCVRRANGQTQCWGRNASGEIGDGSMTQRSSPTTVYGLP